MSNQIKEILCIHHSHLDVGYTHPQHMLLELQSDYLDQVLDLCEKTADYPDESKFRWTCEATYPLMRWAMQADPAKLNIFRHFLKTGQISICAFPFHTTPGCSHQQLVQAFQQLDTIRELFEYNITTAINHDVNGQPWTIASILLESNIDFYLTGINIHFGGIPFPRPYVFKWMTPDGRPLTSYVGEHYSLFSQFCQTDKFDTALAAEGIRDYVKRVTESIKWDRDFFLLTSTNPPLLDNNCPDAQLADLIKAYNEEGHPQKIRMITPEILRSYVQKDDIPLEEHSGDWTDYWNFGSASTARELKFNRAAKINLQGVDLLESIAPACGSMRHSRLTGVAYLNTLLFDEHTWGAAESVSAPEQDETYAQLNHKKEYAYQAADLSSYVLSYLFERFAGNPVQSDHQDGLTILNPTSVPVQQEIVIPKYMTEPGRTVSAARAKNFLPYESTSEEKVNLGTHTIPPYSVYTVPFGELKPHSDNSITVSKDTIETPFYKVELSSEGMVSQITHLLSGKTLLSTDSPWDFFGIVEESINPEGNKEERGSLFPRDVDKGNRNISQWNHNWKSLRKKAAIQSYNIETNPDSVSIIYTASCINTEQATLRITFYESHPRIGLDIGLHKKPNTLPNSLYLTFPVKLQQGWECIYDTAGTFVKLDEQQLGKVCRDYITVDKTVSMMDENIGITLACPDAPMVQVGDFQFARENHSIPRSADPLLLAWPLNNYWDTNFAASQDGDFSFHYELTVFEKFRELSAYTLGVNAARPCIVGAAIDCRGADIKSLISIEGSGDCLPVMIRPSADRRGVLVGIQSFSDSRETLTMRLSAPGFSSACISDIGGRPRQELSVENRSVTVDVPAHGIIYITLN